MVWRPVPLFLYVKVYYSQNITFIISYHCKKKYGNCADFTEITLSRQMVANMELLNTEHLFTSIMMPTICIFPVSKTEKPIQ